VSKTFGKLSQIQLHCFP